MTAVFDDLCDWIITRAPKLHDLAEQVNAITAVQLSPSDVDRPLHVMARFVANMLIAAISDKFLYTANLFAILDSLMKTREARQIQTMFTDLKTQTLQSSTRINTPWPLQTSRTPNVWRTYGLSVSASYKLQQLFFKTQDTIIPDLPLPVFNHLHFTFDSGQLFEPQTVFGVRRIAFCTHIDSFRVPRAFLLFEEAASGREFSEGQMKNHGMNALVLELARKNKRKSFDVVIQNGIVYTKDSANFHMAYDLLGKELAYDRVGTELLENVRIDDGEYCTDKARELIKTSTTVQTAMHSIENSMFETLDEYMAVFHELRGGYGAFRNERIIDVRIYDALLDITTKKIRQLRESASTPLEFGRIVNEFVLFYQMFRVDKGQRKFNIIGYFDAARMRALESLLVKIGATQVMTITSDTDIKLDYENDFQYWHFISVTREMGFKTL